jgi:hypothetical protein
MDEGLKDGLRVHFDGRVKLEFRGASVITHSRYAAIQMAEVAVPRELFGPALQRIR